MKRDFSLVITGVLVAALFSWNLPVMLPGADSVETIAPAALRASDQAIEVEGAPLSVGSDIIVAIDGAVVQDMDDLVTRLSEAAVGQTVALTIVHDGEEQPAL